MNWPSLSPWLTWLLGIGFVLIGGLEIAHRRPLTGVGYLCLGVGNLLRTPVVAARIPIRPPVIYALAISGMVVFAAALLHLTPYQ